LSGGVAVNLFARSYDAALACNCLAGERPLHDEPLSSFPPFDKLRINLAALERESIVEEEYCSKSLISLKLPWIPAFE
jgi:hypothetical protein